MELDRSTELTRLYGSGILRRAARGRLRRLRVNDPNTADDAASDVMLGLLSGRSGNRFDPERGSLAAFARGALRFACLRAATHMHRLNQLPLAFDVAELHGGPADAAVARERAEMVRATLTSLPPEDQWALWWEFGVEAGRSFEAGRDSLRPSPKRREVAQARFRVAFEQMWPDAGWGR